MKRQEIPIPPEYIKWLREHVLGLSLVSFGNIWAVSGPAVHRWEAGVRHPAGYPGLLLLGAIKIARQMVIDENGSPAAAAEEILRLKLDDPEKLLRAANDAGPLSRFFDKGSAKEDKHARAEQGLQRRAAELKDLLNRSAQHFTEQERRALSEIAPRLLGWMADSLWVIIGRGRTADRDTLLARLEQLATEVEATAVTVSQWQGEPLSTSEEESVPE
jgi:hypothetical protein